MRRRRGALATLLGIDPGEPPPPPPPGEVDLANGDIVELDDGMPRRVEVLARLEGGIRVCALNDGCDEELVALDGSGAYWRFAPADSATAADLVAEAYRDDQVVAVRRSGSVVVVSRTGEVPLVVDLRAPGQLGATWLGPLLNPDSGPGDAL